jgi:hypothetical protein
MNLFRSEEHIRNWAQYDPAAEQSILPLENIAKVFSGNFFQKRLDSNYVSQAHQYFGEAIAVLSEIARTLPFWAPPTHQ